MINFYNVSSPNKENKKDPQMASKTNGASRPNFIKYTGAEEDLTGKELKWSLWLAKNKILLYKILVGSLIGLNVIFWGYSLWSWGDYLIFGLAENARLSAEATKFINYSVLNSDFTARPLRVFSTQALANAPGKADFVSDTANLNERFIARFDYHFAANGLETDTRKAFLLPQEEGLIAFLGADENIFGGTPDLILENVRWSRISYRDIADVPAWQSERLNFSVSDFKFINRGSIEGLTSYAVQFKLTNASSYGFVNPRFYVGLYQGQTLIGILPLEITNFRSGETRDIDLRSFTPNLNVTEISLFPLIDIYDDSVYMRPGA